MYTFLVSRSTGARAVVSTAAVSATITASVIILATVLGACNGNSNSTKPVVDVSYVMGDTLDVTGILIETLCYSSNESNSGMNHPNPVPESQSGEKCAQYCARQGYPVGLLTGAPRMPVWMLLATPPLLGDYMERTVRIRGVFRSEGVLIPLRVEAEKSDGSWTFVL
jgi:hypothetical protein